MKLIILSKVEQHPVIGWGGKASFVTDPQTGAFALSPKRVTSLDIDPGTGAPTKDWQFAVGFAKNRAPFQVADIFILPEVGLDSSVQNVGASRRVAMFNFLAARGFDNTLIDTADTVRRMYDVLTLQTDPAVTFDDLDIEQ